jgi:dTDP-4-amino-4,6-dideoxygalactose transaminase
METDHIPVLKPRLPGLKHLSPYLERIDAARVYTNYGPLHEELGARLESMFDSPPGSLTLASSGTAALVGAILAAAGRPNSVDSEAIVPSFTFSATGIAAEICGFRPRIMDVDMDSWTLDPDAVLSAPGLERVGLIIVTSPFGRPIEPASWLRLQEKTGIPVVFDGAACFAVLSSDVDLIDRALQSLNFGFRDSRETVVPAINGKMSEYHAAVGLAELDGWEMKHTQLSKVAKDYNRAFDSLGLGDNLYTAPDISSCYILVRTNNCKESLAVQKSLTTNQVGFRHWYGSGLHMQQHFKSLAQDGCPNAEFLAANLIGLPMAPDLTISNINRVASCVCEGMTAQGLANAQWNAPDRSLSVSLHPGKASSGCKPPCRSS